MTTTSTTDPRLTLREIVESNHAAAFLILAWRTTAPDYRVELVDLQEDVSTQFLTYARRAAERLGEGTPIPYDPEWHLRDHEFFTLTASEFPTGNLFSQLSDFQNLKTFKRKNLTKPKLYVVAVQTSGHTALFGKRMAYLQVLKQKAGAFAAVWDGSTFNVLSESVATFSPQFD